MSSQQQWDQRFLRLARLVALWSKDPSTQCGAVIVRPDHTLASVGFNGFARGMDDNPENYADRTIKYPHILHSEWNAIRSTQDPSLAGNTVYAWPMPPCDECTAPLLQKKIARVVSNPPEQDKLIRWQKMFDNAHDMCTQRNVPIDHVALDEPLLPALEFDHPNKWHGRFLNVAREVSSWSHDPIAPRGAVIVRADKTVSSLGFNGYPQKVDDTPLQSNSEGARSARLIPAELNAILFAQDPTLKGHTVYTWPSVPSLRVINHLIQEEVSTIVAPASDEMDPSVPVLLAKMGIQLLVLSPKSGESMCG